MKTDQKILEDLYELFLQQPTVSTDSRTCPPNAIFFALKGENFDGNNYIRQVLDAGAAFAVGDRNDLPNDQRIIRVADVLQTLQNLANLHRHRMSAKVIAITGTNGKTTTKELIAAVLSSQYPTLYTQGNLNNHIGVPLTLLRLRPEHHFAVIEMGANHPGEIATLCRIAAPDYGLITNVGKAHLEGFGSLEGVLQTKTELYRFLNDNGGTIFGNWDNPLLQPLLTTLQKTILYGNTPRALVEGKIVTTAPSLSLQWGGGIVNTKLVGGYNFENVLAAICIGQYFGVPATQINQALNDYTPTNNRSQAINTGKNQLIVDAYNANPSSMAAALDNFKQVAPPKMVILGEMRELGTYSHSEHQKLTEQLKRMALDRVYLVGSNFQITPLPSSWKIFSTTDELISDLQTHPITDYHILIKGSRTNELERALRWV
ncbi:MAG: UDP-N-acetylmuramoyl-tripeptide--D-alanyl-D-alanine ligase [Candidatus Symbiothrix sp.]|jgi:UDP-N-acetylmuramoyl-tripeptide--D-alanyl-D-alanine ligase|nr:UDP-N-acetylmuramoyl-tripeptide--D-alanyl-D-alanine ligase [Candidatus Symbiothrix sp.]